MTQDGISAAANVLTIISIPSAVFMPLISLWKHVQLYLNFAPAYDQRLATIGFLRLRFDRFNESFSLAYPWLSLSQEQRDYYDEAYRLIQGALKEADIKSATLHKERSHLNTTHTNESRRNWYSAMQNQLERVAKATSSTMVRTQWAFLQQDSLDANINSASTQLQNLENEFPAAQALRFEVACLQPLNAVDSNNYAQRKSHQKTAAAAANADMARETEDTPTRASSLSFNQCEVRATSGANGRLGSNIKFDRPGANEAILAALPEHVSYNGCKLYSAGKGVKAQIGNNYTSS